MPHQPSKHDLEVELEIESSRRLAAEAELREYKLKQDELQQLVEEHNARLQDINVTLIRENQRRAEIELALLEHQRLVEFSNFELEQFATIASHDLQEPLRMVSSYVRLIERRYGDKIGQDGLEFINFAAEGAGRMKTLINALATYARLDRDVQPFEPVELDKVVRDAIRDHELATIEAKADITIEPLPAILGDHTLLSQLFGNLLSNALKYHGSSAPRIHIDGVSSQDGIVVSVSDNGIGIPKRDLERVFLVFRQVDRQSRQHGSGIGLATAKKIVIRHGGSIWAESELGSGTAIRMTFPKPN